MTGISKFFDIDTYCAESCKTFFTEISLNRVNALDNNIAAHIKLFVANKQWVLDVSLHKILIVSCISW